jgi:predicted alpha/beta superfamily hydrolase
MRLATHVAIVLVLGLHTFSANGQQKNFSTFPQASLFDTEVRYLKSAIVGDEFEISIALPFNYRDSDTTYPVLYMTDANMLFAAMTQMTRGMAQPGIEELPQIILVGIGYRIDSLAQWYRLRSRDLTPTITEDLWPTGGAPLFLRFIREELMPFIKKNYRASPDASYAGYSLGGLFGLYVLFHTPEVFQRYIIGSPWILYDDEVTLKYESKYASTHRDLSARIFVSVGELEETAGKVTGSTVVRDMKLLADKLTNRHYPGLSLDTKVFEGETHLSGGMVAFMRGLRSIYQK